MIRSMTGFGRGEASWGDAAVAAEVKSVNGRHLDVRVRLPRELNALEAPVRAAVGRHLERGQVEVRIQLPGGAGARPAVSLDAEVVRSYLEAAERLREEFGVTGQLDVGTLFALPGAVRLEEEEPGVAGLESAVVAAAESACRQLCEMRAREGEALYADLRPRVERLASVVEEVEAHADEVGRSQLDRLHKRLSRLAPELGTDPGRLEQEVVLYVDRMDVTEEIVRLRSHLDQFRSALDRDGAVGRRLEFLVQEIGREANTIGSKAGDAPIAARVVELKTELEKVREQALNVE